MVCRQVVLKEFADANRAVSPPALGGGELGAVMFGGSSRKNFDEAQLISMSDLGMHYSIDWDKDENRLPIIQKDDIVIPGRGSITDIDRCGSFHGSYLSGNKLRAKLYSCHKPTCPRCFREWASRQGGRSAAFIWGIKQWSGDTIYHVVWSPAEGRYTIAQLLKEVGKLMENFHSGGDLGYSYVIHPYRIRCTNGHSAPRERGYSGGKLPQVCGECGMPWQWVWSPHIHMITNFYVDCTSKMKAEAWNQAQGNAGIKFVNVSQDNHYLDLKKQVLVPRPGYIDSVDTLESIVKYELGHSLVRQGGRQQAIVYVGAWCRLNFRAEWLSERQMVLDDDGQPFRRVFSWGEVVGSKMAITVGYQDGKPIWFDDSQNKPVYLFETVWHCKVYPRRRWCAMHHRFERIDPLERVGKDDLKNKCLEEWLE